MPTVGILGVGMVGRALLNVFGERVPTYAYDPHDALTFESPETPPHSLGSPNPYGHIKQFCNIIFICVPTPMFLSGEQDLSILAGVVAKLDAWGPTPTEPLIVIKSTVQPGTTDSLSEQYPEMRFCFNPEFLREATATADFAHQDRIIVGRRGAVPELIALYEKTHRQIPVQLTDPLTAELVKYAGNCFLATKVSFCNEIAQICEAVGVNYSELVSLLVTDNRIGESHTKVPGPDGRKGWGGVCLPKDLNALIHFATKNGVNAGMLRAVWAKNLEVRPEQEWLKLKGRAISNEDQ